MSYEPILTTGGLVRSDRLQHTRDGLLETKVAAALAAARDIVTLDVKVSASGETVHLSGHVPQERHARKAREIAGDIKGVERVISQIAISKDGKG